MAGLGRGHLLLLVWAVLGLASLVGFVLMSEGGGAWLDVAILVFIVSCVVILGAFVWAWIQLFGVVRDGIRVLVDEGSRRPPSA